MLQWATEFEVKSVSVSCLETVTTARFNNHSFEKLSEKFSCKTFFHLPLNDFFVAQNQRYDFNAEISNNIIIQITHSKNQMFQS